MFHFSKSKHVNFAELEKRAGSLLERLPAIRRRSKLRHAYRFIRFFSRLMLAALVLLLILTGIRFYGLFKIYSGAVSGKDKLEQAVTLAGSDKFEAAAKKSQAAEDDFKYAADTAGDLKNDFFLSRWPWAITQLNDAEYLLVSSQFLSKAVYGAVEFGVSLESVLSGDKKLNFSKFSAEEKRAVLEKIYQAGPELNGVKADLDLAYLNLKQMSGTGLSFLAGGQINQLDKKIGRASQVLEKAAPLSQLVPALFGYPNEANFLVMLENTDELRPTGGFLGTYGVMKTRDGEIENFYTHDIYHLDMPAQAKMNVAPPEPIKKYLNSKWYLRDANWSPDWPTAARRIDWFYKTEIGLNPEPEEAPVARFNGVLAITPKLITDLLKITGPVTVEGQTYTEKNFSDLLQYRVEKGFEQVGVSKWQRKEVVGQIAKEIKIKIFDLPPSKWSKIAGLMLDDLESKNILIYFSDDQLENLAESSGWGGEIKNYDRDYLMVVDANLAAKKTDSVMKRSLAYTVSRDADGLAANLILDYSHTGKPDWKIDTYKSYTRVYVPSGSRLIGISGYGQDKIEVGSEAGKTYYGFFFTVEPGRKKTITLNYRLPDTVAPGGKYGLYLQKQPGKSLDKVEVDLRPANGIKSYDWQGDLNTDKSLEFQF